MNTTTTATLDSHELQATVKLQMRSLTDSQIVPEEVLLVGVFSDFTRYFAHNRKVRSSRVAVYWVICWLRVL